jgi:hypothetical protein
MSSKIKIYKVNDFIRHSETGDIDFDRSMQIIHELAAAALFHKDHNILIDMRETRLVGVNDMGTILGLAFEMARYRSVFKGRIANVVPDDEKRLAIAKQFRASLDVQGLCYEVFTNFEDAINWLSDVADLGPSGG